MSSGVKQKRKSYTIEEKLKALNEMNEGISGHKIAQSLGCSRKTVNSWKTSDSLRLLQQENSVVVSKKKKRLRKAENPDVDIATWEWFEEQRKSGCPISGPLVRAQALFFSENLGGSESFEASDGWLTKWKNRFGIRTLGKFSQSSSFDSWTEDSSGKPLPSASPCPHPSSSPRPHLSPSPLPHPSSSLCPLPCKLESSSSPPQLPLSRTFPSCSAGSPRPSHSAAPSPEYKQSPDQQCFDSFENMEPSPRKKRSKHHKDFSVDVNHAELKRTPLENQKQFDEPPKKKLKSFTYEEKKKILDESNEIPPEIICEKYNLSARTLRYWISKKDKIFENAKNINSRNAKRIRDTQERDNQLLQWLVKNEVDGIPISGPLLKKQALIENKNLLGPPNFKASEGWLSGWKKRKNIRCLKITEALKDLEHRQQREWRTKQFSSAEPTRSWWGQSSSVNEGEWQDESEDTSFHNWHEEYLEDDVMKTEEDPADVNHDPLDLEVPSPVQPRMKKRKRAARNLDVNEAIISALSGLQSVQKSRQESTLPNSERQFIESLGQELMRFAPRKRNMVKGEIMLLLSKHDYSELP